MVLTNLPPPWLSHKLSHDFVRAFSYLLIPAEVLYFSLYAKVKGHEHIYRVLTFACLALLWFGLVITPIDCAPLKSLQIFASMYI